MRNLLAVKRIIPKYMIDHSTQAREHFERRAQIRQKEQNAMKRNVFGYNSNLDVQDQIEAEERIASLIRETIEESKDSSGVNDYTLTDDDCAELGRVILINVISRFRTDLIS